MTPLEPIIVGLVTYDPWQTSQMSSPGTDELWEEVLRSSGAECWDSERVIPAHP